MNNATITLTTLLFFAVNFSNAQNWTQLTPPSNYIINSCWFDDTSPASGYFVGWRLAGADPVSYGYRTTDGGLTYTLFNFGYYHWLAQDIYFVNSNVGVSVGGGIARTNNSGTTWDLVVDNISMRGWMYDEMFINANDGYVVGQTYDNSYSSYWGVIYKTNDGGLSWNNSIITYESLNENTEFRTIFSTGSGVVYAGGLNTIGSNSLYKSIDDGVTWSALSFYNDVNSIWFASADTGYIATNLGIYKTVNAGQTWNLVLSTTQAMYSIDIKNNFGFAVGDGGLIYNTTDKGLSWTLMTSPVTSQTLNRVFVVSDSLAYAVGTSGTILKYHDSTVGVESEVNPHNNLSFFQHYPNPISTSSTILFNITKECDVNIQVFDMAGKCIAIVLDRKLSPGEYSEAFDVSALKSGVYFLKISTGEFSEMHKVVLLR